MLIWNSTWIELLGKMLLRKNLRLFIYFLTLCQASRTLFLEMDLSLRAKCKSFYFSFNSD